MGILSGSLGQEFFEFCYNPVGEVSVCFALNIKENQKEGERKDSPITAQPTQAAI